MGRGGNTGVRSSQQAQLSLHPPPGSASVWAPCVGMWRSSYPHPSRRRHGRRIWSWNDLWDKLFAAICVFPWAFAETSDIMKIQTVLNEANPMTRGEALKDFFRKTILPVESAALLYCIFRSACVKNEELDHLWLWILCGLPFGIWRLRLWIIPGSGSLGGGIALFALNFIIGGFVLVWWLIVAVCYVPLTVYRLIASQL